MQRRFESDPSSHLIPGDAGGCLRLDRDDIEHSYNFACDKAKLLERQAVVAWLRREATDGFVTLRINEACAAEKLADAIERGEHRREEKE